MKGKRYCIDGKEGCCLLTIAAGALKRRVRSQGCRLNKVERVPLVWAESALGARSCVTQEQGPLDADWLKLQRSYRTGEPGAGWFPPQPCGHRLGLNIPTFPHDPDN
jgi:hypothetical protein